MKAGDLVTVTVPEQAAVDLATSFSYCKGSSKQNYLAEALPVELQGLNGLLVTIILRDGVDEIPIGAEFGVELAMLHNPESTRPSAPFNIQITDDRKNLVTLLTDDADRLTDFVMWATQPS